MAEISKFYGMSLTQNRIPNGTRISSALDHTPPAFIVHGSEAKAIDCRGLILQVGSMKYTLGNRCPGLPDGWIVEGLSMVAEPIPTNESQLPPRDGIFVEKEQS
jgi:hypothetical protein